MNDFEKQIDLMFERSLKEVSRSFLGVSSSELLPAYLKKVTPADIERVRKSIGVGAASPPSAADPSGPDPEEAERNLSHPEEWDEWYVGYVVLDQFGNKEEHVEVGGPFPYEDAVEKVEDIFEDPQQDVLAQTYVPFVSLQNKEGTYKRAKIHPLWKKGGKALTKESLLKEDKLNKIVINFSELRSSKLNESFLAMFGGWVEHILSGMFGGSLLPVEVVGTKSEVESFAKAIGREKSYIETAKRYGLDHPTTYKSKSRLDVAVKGFEKATGLKWPFK